jgi:diaminopimelate decarboxylase
LCCDGLSLESLARRYGTPLHVVSANAIRSAIRELKDAFGRFDPLICYAMKANGTLGILRLVAREGLGAEVVSGGELYRALRAGVRPDRIVFSGVGKTDEELEASLRAGILLFDVESEPELEALSRAACRTGRRARVALRINPHVDAHTHRYITTGTAETKFGIDIRRAEAAFELAARLPGLEVAGLHTHIGSQITDAAPFAAAAKRVDALLDRLERHGLHLRYRNIGGGFGIQYTPSGSRLDVRTVADRLAPSLARRPLRLVLEPGRFLVGEAGTLLTKVLYLKRGAVKTFAIVDAAMTELIRPCLYRAFHEIVPVRPRRGRRKRMDIVGPVCETADFLGLDRRLPPLRSGDLLAVLAAGAYGAAMSSRYNGRPRAAEVLVDGRRATVIRRRETYADLVRGER